MPKAKQDEGGLDKRAARTYIALRRIDSPAESGKAADELAQVAKAARLRNEPRSLHPPRRGARWEYTSVKTSLDQVLPGVSVDEVVPSAKSHAHSGKELMEAWREAECLALSPHSMSRLKQLPELRQIIAHTTLDAIQVSAGSLEHIGAVAASKEDSKRMLREAANAGDKFTEREVAATILKAAGPSRGPFGGHRRNHWRRRVQEDSTETLFQQLAPGLRLCLAAEVAVGMLCSGQPPPPDTPEHAAALQMFVIEACEHVQQELGDNTIELLQAGLTSDYLDKQHYDTAAAVQSLWGHVTRLQNRSGSGAQPEVELPPPSVFQMPRWGLAPHMDLHLHVPPAQQLQLMCQIIKTSLQQQQQQQQQQCAGPHAATASAAERLVESPSRQNNGSSGQASSTTAAAAPATEVPYSSLRPGIQQLGRHAIQGLEALGTELLSCLEMHSVLSSSSSSTNGSSSLNAGMVLQALLGSGKDDNLCHAAMQAVQHLDGSSSNSRSGITEGMSVDQLAAVLLHLAAALAASENATSQEKQQQSCNPATAAASLQGSSSSNSNQSVTANIDPDALCKYISAFTNSIGMQVMLKFMCDQWRACGCNAAAPAWQQEVPLQVLLLLAQLTQIDELVLNLHPDAARQQAPVQQQQQQQQGSTGSSSSAADAPQQQQQQQQQNESYLSLPVQPQAPQPDHTLLLLLSKVQAMVQSIRVFTAANNALHQGTAVGCNCPTGTEATGDAGCLTVSDIAVAAAATGGCAGAPNAAVALDPVAFFAADGALASGLWGLPEPVGAGVCTQHNSSHNNTGSGSNRQPKTQQQQQQQQQGMQQQEHDASSSTAPPPQTQQTGSSVEQHIWQVLLASGTWSRAVDKADTAAAEKVVSAEFAGEAELRSQDIADGVLSGRRSRSGPAEAIGLFYEATDFSMESEELNDQLKLKQVEVSRMGVYTACAAGKVCSQMLTAIHTGMLQRLGLFSQETKRLKDQCKKWSGQRFLARLREVGTCTVTGGLEADIADDGYALTSEEEDEWPHKRRLRRQHSWGSSHSDDSSGGGNFGGVLEDICATAAGTAAEGPDAAAANRRNMRVELRAAHEAYRQLAAAVTAQLLPLYRWHRVWQKEYRSQMHKARAWWESELRTALAKSAATDKALPEWAQRQLSSSSSSSSSSVKMPPGQCAQPAPTVAASADVDAGASSSSRSGSGSWSAGQHDYHPNCPLCHQEQQQQQQQRDGRPGSSSSTYSSPAVPYTDPFMWRRLLWQLLGKLSPEAQAFYAHYLAMCPHCSNKSVWKSCIQPSIISALWSPPVFDAVDLQLVAVIAREHNVTRPLRLLQYAGALNTGYAHGHLPGLVLLAQQLLLALSPLHAQVLPRPEVAFLLPSSFRPAVGKALQQQLLSRPVLDLFQHHSAKLQMWHVWWHIGIRRYADIKQQEQQRSGSQQQQQWRQPSVDELYMNPDARLYAVSFAMRQLCGTAASDHEKAAVLGFSGSFKTIEAVIQAATNIKRKVLLKNLKPPASEVDQLLSKLSRGVSPDSQAGNLGRPDSQGSGPGTPDLQARGRTSPDRLAGSSSSSPDSQAGKRASPGSSQAGPDCNQAAKALEKMQLLNSEDEQMLQLAVGWPRDVLAPLSARLAAVGSDISPQKALVKKYLDDSVADVLHFAEDPFNPPEGETATADSQEGEEKAQQQQQQQQQRSPWADKLTDASLLALQPPVPLDAFVDPQLWIQRQQQLLDSDNTCAACRKKAEVSMSVCPVCNSARYCNETCLQKDAERHSVMCRRLQSVLLRYAGSSVLHLHSPSCNVIAAAGPFPGLTKLLAGSPHDSHPWGMDCKGLTGTLAEPLVTREVFVQQASVLLAEQLQRVGQA